MSSAFKKLCYQSRQVLIPKNTTDYSNKDTQSTEHMEEKHSSFTKISLTKKKILNTPQQTTSARINIEKQRDHSLPLLLTKSRRKLRPLINPIPATTKTSNIDRSFQQLSSIRGKPSK